MIPNQHSDRVLAVSTLVAALAGILFGYDNIVISGAIGYLRTHFALSSLATGWAAGCALVGCLGGSAVAGPLADRYGLKKALYGCAICFALSSMGVFLAATFKQFVWWRIVGGVGIGAASIVAPMYIAEVSPAALRGRLVILYQLGIVAGILAAVSVNTVIERSGSAAWNTNSGWRWMFAAGAVPALLFLLMIALSRESPRWLMKAGRVNEAREILLSIHGAERSGEEAEQIQDALAEERGSWRELGSGAVTRPLRMGIVLAAFSQASGITALLSYLPEVFRSSGQKADDAFFQSVLVGMVNLLATVCALVMVDRSGRRTLLLAGTALQTLSLSGVVLLNIVHQEGVATLVCIMAFVCGHAIGNGAVCWVVISEIFPNKIRGAAMSIAITALWLSAYLANQFFPVLQEAAGVSGAFLVFAVMAAFNFGYVWKRVPETRGIPLEQMKQIWVQGDA